MDTAHIYVIGEKEEPAGPVKIGIHYGPPSAHGRTGLGTGNWRKLDALHHLPLAAEDARWHEYVIHQHLASSRVRGEWFDVRRFVTATGGWPALLEMAFREPVGGSPRIDLGPTDHTLLRIKMVNWLPPRSILAKCSCGYQLSVLNSTLPGVYKRFLQHHAYQ